MLIECLYDRLARLTGKRNYVQVIHNFVNRTTFIRYLDLSRNDRRAHVQNDMTNLVDCLERRDSKGAIANLQHQFGRKIDILHDLVREGNLRAAKANSSWLERLE